MALQGSPLPTFDRPYISRQLPIRKHLIFYEPYSERIEILRVVHGFQDLEELFDKEGID